MQTGRSIARQPKAVPGRPFLWRIGQGGFNLNSKMVHADEPGYCINLAASVILVWK